MNFRDWYYGFPMNERRALAERLGKSKGYLDLLAGGHRSPSSALAIGIERESDGKVRVETLCPNVDWAYIRGAGSAPKASPCSA